MTSLDNSVTAPLLPAPVPRRGRIAMVEFIRTLRENMVATCSQEAYERDIVEAKIVGRRRILEPGLGKGLITSEAETWRRHRRMRL